MTTQQMLSCLRKGISKYNLIKDGDKIAVGVSGGKDSVVLLKLLAEYKRFSPEKFDLIAVTIDLDFSDTKTDFSPIRKLCEDLGVEYFVEKTDIGKIVFDIRKESNPCALCSKMRKGALNNFAKEKGCNKIALGHHADDAVDTMMLSLLYEGRLSSFAPKTYLDKIDLTLIRPLILTREINVIGYSKTLPIVKSCCPANKKTKREHVKTLIANVCETIPSARDMMFTALIHPERYNLFDKFERDAIEID